MIFPQEIEKLFLKYILYIIEIKLINCNLFIYNKLINNIYTDSVLNFYRKNIQGLKFIN